MEGKKYTEEKLKTAQGRMKARLWEWGDTRNIYKRKCDALARIKKMQAEQENIWQKAEETGREELLRQMEEEYERETERVKKEIAEVMQKKTEMDRMILQLEEIEQKFVELRFQKGYGFDAIGMRIYTSRATLFRMQERILRKLISMEGESETL